VVFSFCSLSFADPNDVSKLPSFAVTRVVDGDTFCCKPDVGGEIKVRLIGVDTPETVHPSKPVEYYGKEASNFTKGLLEGQQVFLDIDPQQGKIDKYGRTLAYVYRESDKLFVNAEIISFCCGKA
jgi:micrococcal nuclease